jgi:hypothetical protein
VDVYVYVPNNMFSFENMYAKENRSCLPLEMSYFWWLGVLAPIRAPITALRTGDGALCGGARGLEPSAEAGSLPYG